MKRGKSSGTSAGARPAHKSASRTNKSADRRRGVKRTRLRWGGNSSEKLRHNVGGEHAGELHVEALVLYGEAFVVEAHQLQHRGVQVRNGHRVFHDIVGKLVGLAVNRARFDAAASQP